MPAIWSQNVYDKGLEYIPAKTTALVICSQQPTTYAEAQTYKLGSKSAPTVSAPVNGTTGRKVTVSAIADGAVTATGTATHYAILRETAGEEELLVSQAIAASQVVTLNNIFTLTEIDVGIPAPTE